MTTRVGLTIVAVTFATLAVTAGPVAAQTVAPGPFFPTPAWDQKLQCDTPATCPRFIVLSNWNNEAVLDRETGLVWERSPSTAAFLWLGGQTHCNRLAVGNRFGWRLPILEELASLVDRAVPFPGPVLPPGHPFRNVQSSLYWSATTQLHRQGLTGNTGGFAVNFFVGSVLLQDKFGSTHFVWCVRGGQGVDPQ